MLTKLATTGFDLDQTDIGRALDVDDRVPRAAGRAAAGGRRATPTYGYSTNPGEKFAGATPLRLDHVAAGE